MRHGLLLLLMLLLAVSGCDGGISDSSPAAYPSRSVTVICPWDPGGGTDRVARFWAGALEREFDNPFVVVNRTGGSGNVGHLAGSQARPDGHTLTLITFELCTMHHMGISQLTHEDFTCLLQFNADPAAIIVQADAPWKDLDAFLEDIRSQDDQKIKMSGTGRGAAWDLARAGWLRAAGVPVDATIWVPADGAAPSLVALLGGHVDAVCCSVPEAASQLEAGQLRVLAVMADERLKDYPDIPTVRESGHEWTAVGWRGLALPRDTSPAIVETLRERCEAIANSPEFEEYMKSNFFGIELRSTDEVQQFLKQQDEVWGEVIKAVGYAKS